VRPAHSSRNLAPSTRCPIGSNLRTIARIVGGRSRHVVLPVYAVATLHLSGWVPGVAFTVNCILIALGQGLAVSALIGRSRASALQLSALLVVASAPVMLLAAVVSPMAATALVLAGVVIFTAGELNDSPVMAALPARLQTKTSGAAT